jgi:hypothetical protein
MPLWGFNKEANMSAAGANVVAGLVRGQQAPYFTGDAAEQVTNRNMIVKPEGWVYRENRGTRRIEQVIVAANPGGGQNYNDALNMGRPDIAQIYVKLNANGFISANASLANLYVVFNTPIAFRASGNLVSITVANTIGGNNAVARLTPALANSTQVINANNTLVFRLPAMQGGAGSVAATYKINSQTISSTGNPLYNPEIGIASAANLVLTGATSNTLLDGLGRRVITFQVRRNG